MNNKFQDNKSKFVLKIRNNKIILLLNLIIISLIKFIVTDEPNNNYPNTKNIIYMKVINIQNRKIINAYFPDIIYLNDIPTEIDDYGYIKSKGREENNVTLIWNDTLESCENLFKDLDNIIEIDLSKFDTSKVASMQSMFQGCENLKYINFHNINTSSVTNMSAMFGYCDSLLSIDLSNFDTSKVTDMSYMFQSCSSLTSLDILNLNMSNGLDITGIFSGCKSLKSLDLKNFDV